MRSYYILILPILALPGVANAEGEDAAQQVTILSAQAALTTQDAALADGASPFAVSAIGENELRAIAGREDTTQIAQNEQFAGVANNSVGNNSVTGDARISDNAFQNMSGLSILNVNTGNNVAINASMNVNVSISPAP